VPRAVFVISRAVSLLCLLVLGALAVGDARAGRITAGRVPTQFARPLDARAAHPHGVLGIAHNAGDELATAARAAAYGAGAIEIDVRSAGSELLASHDAPLPFLEDVVFRGPSLQQAWNVARPHGTVLLHLKERSPVYLRRVRDFLRTQRGPRPRLIIQTDDPGTLRTLQRTVPWAQRLLLVLRRSQLAELRDPAVRRSIDGVSVRDRFVTPALLAWCRGHGLATFVWTVNDERRMNFLVQHGVTGLITDRLDILRVLGSGGR
jgi:glycerophosphoryl diester phosphodiesterase